MRFDSVKSFAIAASLAIPMAASAQYSQGVQPYSPQDPQNYSAPATQSYSDQQAQYGSPQGQYDQQAAYPQGGQEQIYQAPPPLPVYDQPAAPDEGYIWTPGYWAFGPGGYYWVPGAWVFAPYEGALWTPGYWGYAQTGYFWNTGYWGNEVGYYGGINYGFGYFGIGFYGGCWRDHRFWYNREYSHVGFRGNVYSERFNGIRDPRPTGRSFTPNIMRGNEFRGGSYNGAGRGFANAPIMTSPRGPGAPGQLSTGRPVYPGSTYSEGNRGSYNAPMQRPVQTIEGQRTPGNNGGFSQRMPQAYNGGGYSQRVAPVQSFPRSAPSAPQYSAPSPQRFSPPSGGGGGGGSHGGGGGRR